MTDRHRDLNSKEGMMDDSSSADNDNTLPPEILFSIYIVLCRGIPSTHVSRQSAYSQFLSPGEASPTATTRAHHRAHACENRTIIDATTRALPNSATMRYGGCHPATAVLLLRDRRGNCCVLQPLSPFRGSVYHATPPSVFLKKRASSLGGVGGWREMYLSHAASTNPDR